MADKCVLKDRVTGEVLYPVTSSECVVGLDLYEEITPTNGYDFIDMGEAGIWAVYPLTKTKNSRQSDDVLYFAWGETDGFTYNDVFNGVRAFNEDSYKWGTNGRITKYCTNATYGAVDNKTKLDLEDDAAHVNMGGQWRMPTIEEFRKLESLCNVNWGSTTRFTLKTDPSKQIVFPSVNNVHTLINGEAFKSRDWTGILSSNVSTNNNNSARVVYYEYDEDDGEDGMVDDTLQRYYGSPIIAILDPTIPYDKKVSKYVGREELKSYVKEDSLATTLSAYTPTSRLPFISYFGNNIGRNNREGATGGNYAANLGDNTTTLNNYETAMGCLNAPSRNSSGIYSFGQPENTLFTIGNGRLGGNPHNAFEVRENGDTYIPDTSVEGERDTKPMFNLQKTIIQQIEVATGTSLSPEVGKYYRFDEAVNNLNINLPNVDSHKVSSLIIYFTTGDTPAININSSSPIEYFAGFNIGMRSTYELNFMFNGSKWVVGYGII